MNLLLVSILLAFVVGFSAHRAGVCTVAAVAELRSTNQARLFISFLKTVLWIVLISKTLLLWHPELARVWQVDSTFWLALAGGFIFGVGATISGGLLYTINGKWAYSSIVVQTVTGRSGNSVNPDTALYLFMALLAGAIFSALSGRRFKFSFAGDKWSRNLAGGFLMGFGAMMVPGGNSALILQGLPQLSLHAITAYPAMILGIMVAMKVLERITGKALYVNCSGDQCRVEL